MATTSRVKYTTILIDGDDGKPAIRVMSETAVRIVDAAGRRQYTRERVASSRPVMVAELSIAQAVELASQLTSDIGYVASAVATLDDERLT